MTERVWPMPGRFVGGLWPPTHLPGIGQTRSVIFKMFHLSWASSVRRLIRGNTVTLILFSHAASSTSRRDARRHTAHPTRSTLVTRRRCAGAAGTPTRPRRQRRRRAGRPRRLRRARPRPPRPPDTRANATDRRHCRARATSAPTPSTCSPTPTSAEVRAPAPLRRPAAADWHQSAALGRLGVRTVVVRGGLLRRALQWGVIGASGSDQSRDFAGSLLCLC